jgi:hypothetical protein
MKHLKLGLFLLAGGITTGAWNQLSDSNSTIQERPLQEPEIGQMPTPKKITAQVLRTPNANGNVLVTAAFDQTDPRLRGVTAFRLALSDQLTVVLSDNGMNGDVRANDGVFTTTLRENTEVLSRTLTEFNVATTARQRTNQAIINFAGRSVEARNPSDMQRVAAPDPIVLTPGGEASVLPITFSTQLATVSLTPADFTALKNNSLMVTAVNVVQDPTRTYNPCIGGTAGGNPNGAWTFKTLMTNMANTPVTGVTADNFVKNWLDTEQFGLKTHPLSGDVAADRPASKQKFIAAWLKNSGIAVNSANLTNWKTLLVNKLEFIPLRLLAIVNRLDLRGNFAYTGGTTSGGEGRFVFGFMDSNAGCTPGAPMTVILEYGIPLTTCSTLNAYAQHWYNLKNLALGSAAYNTALQAITDVFTKANANPSRPNKSALNHLRTNEILSGGWVIRDFEINATSRQLNIIHPNHEPQNEANTGGPKVGLLNTFVNANAVAIANDQPYTIPDNIKAMDALQPIVWNSTGIASDAARHKLSLGTCSSCHTGETKTGFTHVSPAPFGTQAGLSSFLTGLGMDDETADGAGVDSDPMGLFWVKDPANRPIAAPTKRGFNDLLRRANDLATFVGTSCGTRGPLVALVEALSFQKMQTPH